MAGSIQKRKQTQAKRRQAQAKTHLCAQVKVHADLKRGLLVGADVDAVHPGVRGRYLEKLTHHQLRPLNRSPARLLGRQARKVK